MNVPRMDKRKQREREKRAEDNSALQIFEREARKASTAKGN